MASVPSRRPPDEGRSVAPWRDDCATLRAGAMGPPPRARRARPDTPGGHTRSRTGRRAAAREPRESSTRASSEIGRARTLDREADHPGLPEYHPRLKGAGRRERPPDHVPILRRRAPERLAAAVHGLLDETRRGGRMFAQAPAARLSRCCVQDADAVRPPAAVEGAAQAAAGRERSPSCRDPDSRGSSSRPPTRSRTRRRSVPGAAAAVRVALRVRHVEGRHRSWPRSRRAGVHPAQAMIDLGSRRISTLLPVCRWPTRTRTTRSRS